jgi:uncharacterized protein (DUF1015 family)
LPQIKPFRGVLYNTKKIKNLATVVAPPYDVISKKQQDSLYRANPYNIVRLELGKIKPSDDQTDNRYTRAKRFFDSWLRDGAMVRDDKESLYIYSQQYKQDGKTIERIGFMGLMGIESKDGKKVLPHENTLLAPKVDRLDLMRSVRANLSPIYVLYDDTGDKVAKILKDTCRRTKPFMDIYFEGIRSRTWRLDEPKAIRNIERLISNKDIFIADGHHRYEVARMYSEELAKKGLPDAVKETSRSLMVYFVASDEKMLTVLPAHRLPRDIGRLTKDEIINRLEPYFHIRKVAGLKAMMAAIAHLKDRHAFGVYTGGGKFIVLVLKDVKVSDDVIKDKPKDWKRLDVAILHRFIFQHVLGIKDSDENIEFVKSPEETAKLVDKGAFKVAFFLNPTEVAQVKRIAKLGEKMPRKATYFYPKPISGVVINKF